MHISEWFFLVTVHASLVWIHATASEHPPLTFALSSLVILVTNIIVDRYNVHRDIVNLQRELTILQQSFFESDASEEEVEQDKETTEEEEEAGDDGNGEKTEQQEEGDDKAAANENENVIEVDVAAFNPSLTCEPLSFLPPLGYCKIEDPHNLDSRSYEQTPEHMRAACTAM